MDENQLGTRILLTVLLLLIVVWFFAVNVCMKQGALEIYATAMRPDHLDKFWQRVQHTEEESTSSLQDSSATRETFHRRHFLPSCWFVHRYLSPFCKGGALRAEVSEEALVAQNKPSNSDVSRSAASGNNPK